MIKVIIADDHKIFRQGLKQIISDYKDIEIVGEAERGSEVITICSNESVDVAILDISMPGGSGLEILPELKNINPDIRILYLSMYPEEHFAVRAFKAGADGYLTKTSASDDLIKAIRQIYDGRKYITLSIAEMLASDFDKNAHKLPHERLTNREFQIMQMIAAGKAGKEIANELFISVKTVSTHRENILRKMKMKNDAEVALYAAKNHLI